MDEAEFLSALKAAIENCQIARYFQVPGDDLAALESHYDLAPDLAAIRQDLQSPGGIKGSHAQRRMLLILVTLWDPLQAQALFGEDFAILPTAVMAMDLENRGIFAELIYTYPGWAG